MRENIGPATICTGLLQVNNVSHDLFTSDVLLLRAFNTNVRQVIAEQASSRNTW